MQYRMQLLPLPIEEDNKFYKITKYITKEVLQTYNKPIYSLNLQIANIKKTRDK
jgi:hypothetical protein